MAKKTPSKSSVPDPLADYTLEEIFGLAREALKAGIYGPNPDWERVKATCPRCGRTGPVEPMFGTRVRPSGVRGPQGYCKDCRVELRAAAKTRGEK